jgi:hypothetical protein
VPTTGSQEADNLASPQLRLGGAGGARTHDRRIMRSTASCNTHASCIDDTHHCTDGSHHAGIIWRAGPRTGPRPRRLYPLVLLLCVTSHGAPSLRPRDRARRSRKPMVYSTLLPAPPYVLRPAQTPPGEVCRSDAVGYLGFEQIFAAFSRSGRRVRVGYVERAPMPAGAPQGGFTQCRISQKPP